MLARLPVFTQIGLGFALGALLIAAAASQTYARVREMRSFAVQALALEHASTLSSDVLTQMLEGEAAARGFASTRDPRYLAAGHAAAARASQNVAALEAAGASRALQSNRLEQIVVVAARIRRDVARADGAFDRIVRAAGGTDARALREQLFAEPKIFEALRHDRGVLLAYTGGGARQALLQLDAARHGVAITLAFSTLAAIGLFLLVAGLAARNIARRLHVVTQALREVSDVDVPALIAALGTLSEGDLSARFSTTRTPIEERGCDEIAGLARSYNELAGSLHAISGEFEQMTHRLRETIGAVSGSARDIAGRSDAAVDAAMDSLAAVSQIYVAVRGVADAAALQIESISAARSQVRELNYTAQLIAQSADFLPARIARRNAFIAQDLRESVKRVLSAMLAVEESATLHAGMAESATSAAAELCAKLETIDVSSRRSFAQSQTLRAAASAFRNHGTELKEAS